MLKFSLGEQATEVYLYLIELNMPCYFHILCHWHEAKCPKKNWWFKFVQLLVNTVKTKEDPLFKILLILQKCICYCLFGICAVITTFCATGMMPNARNKTDNSKFLSWFWTQWKLKYAHYLKCLILGWEIFAVNCINNHWVIWMSVRG